MTNSILVTALALAIGSSACGGTQSASGNGGRRAVPVIPAAKPKALRQFERGLSALKLGGPERYEKARPRFERAVELDANMWEAWHNLGAIRFAANEDDEAASAFSRALAINPVYLPTRLARAEAYRRSGDTKKAIKDYEAAIADDATSPIAYARLAAIHRERKDFEEGLDIIRKALVEAGSAPEIYVEQGLLFLAQGRDGIAELVLLKAAALNEKEPAIYNALAMVSLARGRDQEAFERFATASALDPSYLDARFNRASVLLDAGDYAGAKAELSDIVSRSADDLELQIALGVAHRGLGEYDQARGVWEKVARSATKRSSAAGDALWNLAILTMDFDKKPKKAEAALQRYLDRSSNKHPKRKSAKDRLAELAEE